MKTNPEIPTDEFYRIKRLPPYVFAEVNKLKAQLRADGQDIIDFGFGNPDLPTPQHVIDKLSRPFRSRASQAIQPPVESKA